ncbi:MarR family winged helix-turn-helix transcriptional regulator [Pseudonocardia benzenivorans]|uniref:MarR family winged helix-turn-helix transcriptional regulator n=1 Tax=Pseudonocardia benzenivorans TaxID=228005 RepID=A0ABW3VPN0_9PSEU
MEHTRWLDDDEQRTWRAFLSATRLVFDRVERQMSQDSGMPQTYYELLVRLSEAPGRTLRMSTLADNALSSRSRLSHAVARLEENGWVRRSTCATDRRGAFAELTDEGMAALEAAAPGHVETVRATVFDPLTRAQQHALREASEALVTALAPGRWPMSGDTGAVQARAPEQTAPEQTAPEQA